MGRALEDDVLERLEGISELGAAQGEGAPVLWAVVDGLDEAPGAADALVELLARLAVPGTVWVVAGRAGAALESALSSAGAEPVLPNGLGRMSTRGIRAMLLEGLGSDRYALLRQDKDHADGVSNPFVERLAVRADGLPLYVHHVLEDLRKGRITVSDAAALPSGLGLRVRCRRV